MKKVLQSNKSLIICLLVSLIPEISCLAQEGGFAPLNPEFTRYMEQHKELEKNLSTEENKFGYVPSPLQLNFANYKGTSGVDAKQALPSRFDLRDSGYVSPVKNQNPAGTCWAFATIGVIESNWLLNHQGSYDLSEQNLVACNHINIYYQGGWGTIASAYLTRFSGPVLESDDPYAPVPFEELGINSEICTNISYPVPRYVLTSAFLPPDLELIKRTIMNYGGVYDAYTIYSSNDEYYNASDYTYYCNGNSLIGMHAVVLVGWDDDKVVTGGPQSPKGTKGAWIVKNSWGPSWGEQGYFYLSYYSKGSYMETLYFDEFADTAEIDQINMYDDLGASRSFGYGNEVAYGLTAFNAPAKEIIKKVGTFIVSACSSIDIEIYDDFMDGSLMNLLYAKKNIPCELPGQRVFDLAAEVEGDYYVKIKYNTPACYYPIPVETYIENALYLAPEIMSPGTNWVSEDGENWEAIGSGIDGREMDLTIRSYTVAADKPYGFFEIPEKQLCICDSLSVFAELSDSALECYWQFLPDGQPMYDTGSVPANVTFGTPGTKSINLILGNENGYDTLSQSLEVVTSLDINISSSFENRLGYAMGERQLPNITAAEINKPLLLSVREEADSFLWNPPYDTINQSEIYVIPDHVGENIYNVTAYQGTCTGQDTIVVEGYERPVNDDIRDAVKLHEGMNGPFTNYYATVEENEPTPPFEDCGLVHNSHEGFWCKEGGLQNSVWFWFPAENDTAKIFTDAMFNQLAVYEADSAGDLFNDQYSLLSTYDNGTNPSASFLSRNFIKNLKVGKRNYVQFDGPYSANDIFNIGLYYPKDVRVSADTLYLQGYSTDSVRLIVQGDTILGVIRTASWIGSAIADGNGEYTLYVFSNSDNYGTEPRTGHLTITTPFAKSKITVIQQSALGIDGLNGNSKVVLYPNPVSDELYIRGMDTVTQLKGSFRIFDITGRMVMNSQIQNHNKINVSDLSPGLYLLDIRQNNIPVTLMRFIKE